MAEEGLSPQMMPLAKIDDDDISFRRNSTGKKVSSNSNEKVISRYLRASTGSCHDFCKYGHKHASEENVRRPIPRRVAAKSTNSSISVETVASRGKKSSSATVVKVKSSPNAANMTRSLDRLRFVDSDVHGEGKEMPSVKLKAEASSKPLKQKVSAASTERLEVSLKKEKNSSVKQKSVTTKSMPSPQSSGGLNGNGDTKISKRTVASRVASAKVSPRPSLSSVASSNKKNKSLKNIVSPPNGRNDVGEAETAQPENREVEVKTLYVIKTETEDTTLDTDQIEICAQEVEYAVKMENGDDALELDQTEHCAREDEYVDEIEIEDNNTLELDHSDTCDPLIESLPQSLLLSDQPSTSSSLPDEEEDHEELEYTMSESEDGTFSEYSEAESVENSETLDANTKMHKGSGMVRAEDEDEKAWKMKFRRGTVVEIQAEDYAPRRLKFRRGKLLDNQDAGADGRRRRFKRRGEGGDGIGGNGAEIVVLKHQDVQGKKDAQGLFNNVIEETASKLVESRKSKVKALVGAFETVISLQDGKPVSNTTVS